MALPAARSSVIVDPLSGEALFADVRRYESFGVHRYGSPGAAEALHWIAAELARAGLEVTTQRFAVPRQYEFSTATLAVGGQRLDVVPQWWMPEAQAACDLNAPIAATGFARLALPFDRGAYLNDGHRRALETAFARKPLAVLLTIDHPSREIFTYNVDQASRPWPVPVILVAPKDGAALDAAERSGTSVSLHVSGRYRRDVEGSNVVGLLDRGHGRWLVLSTPVTSWFTSTCERGPGIAGFLAMARLANRFARADLAFVATSGHEIGHGGMEHFMRDGAPAPDQTLAWAHFGATLACRDMAIRLILRSSSMEALTDRHFRDIDGTRVSDSQAAIGELREVHGAGYRAFFGMAGLHRFFHTPADTAAGTAPELLAPVIAAYAGALSEIAG